ncbi:hypothetical protein V491_01938 [Pseudogymnoascus sp. VKM F-3775]|nr:hypothetical protein V491_01938 [Pseudogymnoascus sp. VKM F-3775]
MRMDEAFRFSLAGGIPERNMGRSNGLVKTQPKFDNWEKLYYDFIELRASTYALSRRADKIQDGIVGLVQVFGNEQSELLNYIVALFSLLIIPFTIVGAIYGANLT